jgi:hypothetical protein
MERNVWIGAVRRLILRSSVTGSVLWALACSPPDDGAGVYSSSFIQVEARTESGVVIEGMVVDSTWWLSGDQPGSVGTRHSLLPDTAEFMAQLVHSMVRNAQVVRARPGPWEEGGSPGVRWDLRLDLPGSATFRSSVRGQFEGVEGGGWGAEGPFSRDFRWIIRTGEVPDTVRIDLSGTFMERRDSRGNGEFRLTAEGSLGRASTGEALDLRIVVGTATGAASSGAVARRQESMRAAELREPGEA